MTPVASELADKIIQRLNLGYVDRASVALDTQLFGQGFELDSLDALEIAILVEEDYGITISVAERGEAVFGTLGDLARFVEANRGRDRAA